MASFVWTIITFFLIDNSGLDTLHATLFFIYNLFVLITLMTYRVGLIGREKIKWTSLILTLLILVCLFLMDNNKDNVTSYWNYALVGYVLLCGESILHLIPANKPFSTTSKMATFGVMFFFVVMIAFQLESPNVYYVAQILVILLSLMLLVNYFLKARKA